MKFLIIIDDMASQVFSFSVNAKSANHAKSKAYRHSELTLKTVVKRIRVLLSTDSELIYNYERVYPFPLVRIR